MKVKEEEEMERVMDELEKGRQDLKAAVKNATLSNKAGGRYAL